MFIGPNNMKMSNYFFNSLVLYINMTPLIDFIFYGTFNYLEHPTKHGQIYHYITHIDLFCTNIFHVQLVMKNF